MPTNAERRGSISGSITGNIKLSTSRYAGKLRQSLSHLLSSTPHRRDRECMVTMGGDEIEHADSEAVAQITEGRPEFSKTWIPIAKAGAGGQVDVFFAINREWLDSSSFKHINRLNKSKRPADPFKPATDSTLPALASGVRVIKLPKQSARSVVDRYRMKLRGESDASDFSMLQKFSDDPKRVPRLIDWDRLQANGPPTWTVQEAFNCGTLYEFGNTWTDLNQVAVTEPANPSEVSEFAVRFWPEALIWHVFIELAAALHFIHCAGIAHCDLVAFNICLHMDSLKRDAFSMTQPPEPRFPRLMLIDFGRARAEQPMDSPFSTWDTTRLGDLMHEIVHRVPFSSAASNGLPASLDMPGLPAPERRTAPRDSVTGLCNCTMDGFTAEKRLSPRGQIVYRELMRYTAPMPNTPLIMSQGNARPAAALLPGQITVGKPVQGRKPKTMEDIAMKILPQARTARSESFSRLFDDKGACNEELANVESILDAIVRSRFPGEEMIWSKLRAAAKK